MDLGDLAISIIVFLLFFFFSHRCLACCRRCCGCKDKDKDGATAPRKGKAGKDTSNVSVAGSKVSIVHLRRKKELTTAYILWFFAGFFGAHHFYLDRVVHGALCAWSFNFGSMGWCFDAFLLPFYVSNFNGGTARPAPSDRSCRRLICWGPLVAIAYVAFLFYVVYYTPRMVHNMGFIDLDQRMANTTRNPYDVLGVSRDADRTQVSGAYSEKMRKMRDMQVCDRECRAAKKELNNAYNFVSGASWKRTEDSDKKDTKRAKERSRKRTEEGDTQQLGEWTDWADFVALEWKALGSWSYEAINAVAASVEKSADSWATKEDL